MKKTQPEMSNCSCEESQVNVWTALIIESIVIPVVSGFGFLANLRPSNSMAESHVMGWGCSKILQLEYMLLQDE